MLVTYQVRSDARSIGARAETIAVEQSVEMPVSAIADARVRDAIVGRVLDIRPIAADLFEVRIALADQTVGDDAGQLLNMLFGNTSLHDDVTLVDADIPGDMTRQFGGPRHGVAGLRRRAEVPARALTCSALKPQGLPPAALAQLAGAFARGGIDFIKDDHGLADQPYSPFAARVTAITAALDEVAQATGKPAHYVPSLSGSLDHMRRQIALARAAAIDTVMIAPMIAGLSNFHQLTRETPDVAFVAHPTMAGAARIAPPLLLGKLFRLLGADAVIFPNHGGRFGYSAAQCRDLARAARDTPGDLKPALPVPAGGMSRARVAEMLDFYGPDIMLLIGGHCSPQATGSPRKPRPFVPTSQAIDTHEFLMDLKMIRKARDDYRWDGVDERPYKEDARALFRAVTRQVLFSDPGMQGELRYFEVAPGGYSTLERHEHMHACLVLRGRGHCLVGSDVRPIETRDLVTVPPMTWHQFRATADEPLGFLCMVDAERDKPQLPGPDDLAALKTDPAVAAFLDGTPS